MHIHQALLDLKQEIDLSAMERLSIQKSKLAVTAGLKRRWAIHRKTNPLPFSEPSKREATPRRWASCPDISRHRSKIPDDDDQAHSDSHSTTTDTEAPVLKGSEIARKTKIYVQAMDNIREMKIGDYYDTNQVRSESHQITHTKVRHLNPLLWVKAFYSAMKN